MAACIKFLLNCSKCSKNINLLHSRVYGNYVFICQWPLICDKNLRCLQSFTQLTWEDRSIVKTNQVRQFLQVKLQPKLHARRVNEEKKDKSKDEFLKMLYGRGRDSQCQESVEEYYTQTWLSHKPSFEEIPEDKTTEGGDELTTESHHVSSNALPENKFGTLMGTKSASLDHRHPNERMDEMFGEEDEDLEWKKSIPLTKFGRKNRPVEFYNRHIKRFAGQGKIKEAIAVFDRWMLIEDRVQPRKTTFITLLTCLSKLGYTRKTFQLFRQMKHMGLDPPPVVYTLLFYSCENCPMPEYGLKRANNLYHQMKDSGIEMSLPTVKSAVRAFGRCGNFAKAFQILDETVYPLDIEFFNALLIACISDRNAGFKRALQVWLLMGQHNIKPVEITYNLLAHCMRDSGIGDPSNFVSDLALNVGRLNHSGSEIEIFDKAEGSNIFLKSSSLHAVQQQYLPLSTKGVECDSITKHRNSSNLQSFPAQIFQSTVNKHGRNSVLSSEKQNKTFSDEGDETVVDLDEDFIRHVTDDKFSVSRQTNINSVSSMVRENNNKGHDSTPQDGIVDVKSEWNDEKKNVSSLTVMEKQLTVKLSNLNSPSGRLSLLGGMESFLSHMQTNNVQPDAKTFTLLLASLPRNAESEMKLLELMESQGVTPEIDLLNDMMMRRNRRFESHTLKDILQLISKFRLTPNMRTYAALAISCEKERDGFRLIEDMKAANLEPTEVVMGHFIQASRLNFGYKLRLLRVMEELDLKPSERLILALEKSISKAKQKIVQAENQQTSQWFVSRQFQESFQKFLRFYRPWLKRTEIHRPRHPWDGLEESLSADGDGEGKSTTQLRG